MSLLVPQDPIVYVKYQLLDLLARGGMGEVFKARSHGVEGFEKILVIKRILPELSKSQRFVEMFMPEVVGEGDGASLSVPDRLRTLVEQRLS